MRQDDTRVNPSERDFEAIAKAHGWEVTKRGWPDFILYKHRRIALVEVKMPGTALKQEQFRLMNILEHFTLPCFRWDSDLGFTSLEKLPVFKDPKELDKWTPEY